MNWLKNVLFNGLALAIPLGVIVYVTVKIVGMLERGLAPLSRQLGIDRLLGELTLTILAILTLIILVILLGLLMQIPIMNRLRTSMEEAAMWLFPSLARLKSIAAEKMNILSESNTWKPVVARIENQYVAAFIVEETDHFMTLNVMMTSSMSDGELLIVARDQIEHVPISMDQMMRCSRNFGSGFAGLLESSGLNRDIPSGHDGSKL